MKIKQNKALAGVDMVLAIFAVMIFSTLIFSMLSNNAIENVKLKKEALAMIYMTQIFENIAIEDYNSEAYNNIGPDYVQINAQNVLIPDEVLNSFIVEMAVISELEGVTNNENIMKKIKIRLTYEVADKKYICSMERMKVKE